jgi:hypothetical protein
MAVDANVRVTRVVGITVVVELGPVPAVAPFLHDGDDLEVGAVPAVLDDDGILWPTSEGLANGEGHADDVVHVDVDGFPVRGARRTARRPAGRALPASIVIRPDAFEEAACPRVILVVTAAGERLHQQ